MKKTIALAAIASEHGRAVIEVPGAALEGDDRISVWDRLYRWLEREHGYSDARRNLQNDVRAGDTLMTRLLKAERARIRRRNPHFSRKDLDRAVSFSDGNAGPFTTYRRARIVGDGLVHLEIDAYHAIEARGA